MGDRDDFKMKSFVAAGLFFACSLAHAQGMVADTACDAALAQFNYVQATQEADALLKQNQKDAAAWVCLARARYEQGHFNSALEALNEAANHPAETPLKVRQGNWFGVTLRRLGRLDEAWIYQQNALRLAQQINDQAGLATALHNTAGMRYDRRDAFGALRDYQTSIPINPDLAERSASYNNTGLIYQDMGDVRRARQSLEAAIALNRAGNHFHHLGKHLMNLGNLERTQQRYDEARRLLDEGRALLEKTGDIFWLGVAAHYRAWLANDLKQAEVARAAYGEATRYYQQAGAAGEVNRVAAELRALIQPVY